MCNKYTRTIRRRRRCCCRRTTQRINLCETREDRTETLERLECSREESVCVSEWVRERDRIITTFTVWSSTHSHTNTLTYTPKWMQSHQRTIFVLFQFGKMTMKTKCELNLFRKHTHTHSHTRAHTLAYDKMERNNNTLLRSIWPMMRSIILNFNFSSSSSSSSSFVRPFRSHSLSSFVTTLYDLLCALVCVRVSMRMCIFLSSRFLFQFSFFPLLSIPTKRWKWTTETKTKKKREKSRMCKSSIDKNNTNGNKNCT